MTAKTVLITGSSSGIGRATAEAFLDEDWTVYATARDTDDVSDLEEQGAETAALDVTEGDQIESVVDRVVDEQGGIDCLVNNAGYGQFGAVEDVPVEAVHDQFDVNLYGPHRLTRAVLPHMRDAGEGTIVNVSSVAGRISTPGQGVYASSKFALEGLTDALRNEVDDHGIDVVLVEPGPISTSFDDRAKAELDDDRLERSGAYDYLYEFYEQQRIFGGTSAIAGDPAEVAEVIREATCSSDPEARYPVGGQANLLLLGRFVPDRLRDTVFRFASKLV